MGEQELHTALDFLKALAHESRLKIIGLLAARAHSVGELAELLDLKEPTVSHHLARLTASGLATMRAEGTTHYYALDAAALHQLRRDLFTPERVTAFADDVQGDVWERKVLATFFVDGRLTKIPDTHKKRLVILRWLVGQFDADTRYPEAQVNALLKQYHPDVATLRREFIANALMAREAGVYWRLAQPGEDQVTGNRG